MDVNIIMQLIGSLGFPIACCIYLIHTINESNKAHTEEINRLRETVENNTLIMTKIYTKLDLDFDLKLKEVKDDKD